MTSISKEDEAFRLFKTGEYAKSRQIFTELLEGETVDTIKNIWRNNLAGCYAAEGNHEKAHELLVENNSGQNTIALSYNRALCLHRLGKFDAAIEQLGRLPLDGSDVIEEQLARAILDLTSICVESNHAWDRHYTNYRVLENTLIKARKKLINVHSIDDHVWQRNLAHLVFLSDTRYEDCLRLYDELLVSSSRDSQSSDQENVLSFAHIDPAILRNLCVSYILTGHNRDAEQLIKEIEREDKGNVQTQDSDLSSTLFSGARGNSSARSGIMRALDSGTSHLLHVNLAIGTLYCVKNNYEFGLSRIIETLEPVDMKLSTFVWKQAKRCILSLIDKHCRQLIYTRDDLFDRVVTFLMQCEASGIQVLADGDRPANSGRNSVTFEARHLRAILLGVIHD